MSNYMNTSINTTPTNTMASSDNSSLVPENLQQYLTIHKTEDPTVWNSSSYNNVSGNTSNDVGSLSNGMVSNAANIGSKFNANGNTFINLGGDVSKLNPTALGFKNQTELQQHLVKVGDNYYLKQNEGFMQKYGTGIQVGLGIGQLGLGLASYLDNHKMMKQSIENMKEQLSQSRSEYARLNALRSKLTKSYNSK